MWFCLARLFVTDTSSELKRTGYTWQIFCHYLTRKTFFNCLFIFRHTESLLKSGLIWTFLMGAKFIVCVAEPFSEERWNIFQSYVHWKSINSPYLFCSYNGRTDIFVNEAWQFLSDFTFPGPEKCSMIFDTSLPYDLKEIISQGTHRRSTDDGRKWFL